MYPIHETAHDTAAKIRELLSQYYPGAGITVSASQNMVFSHVDIDWVDGPLQSAIEQKVQYMCPGSGTPSADCEEGYEWKGKRYRGTNYVFCHRQLSQQRREVIRRNLSRYADPDEEGEYTAEQWEEAEQHLILEGKLEGKVELTEQGFSNIVLFPAKQIHDQLTPDQALKFELLSMFFQSTGLRTNHVLLRNGNQIDELFSTVANVLFHSKN